MYGTVSEERPTAVTTPQLAPSLRLMKPSPAGDGTVPVRVPVMATPLSVCATNKVPYAARGPEYPGAPDRLTTW
jgi:hypothetical protein